MEKLPTVDAVRPPRCPACGTASRPTGGRLVIQGHGLRERQLRGPSAPDGRPELRVLRLRRYRCTACTAILTVVPRDILTRRLYSGPAIAWALALFGVLGLSTVAIRQRVSPFAVVGATAFTRWKTLVRWVSAVAAGQLFPCVRPPPPDWSTRQVAERAAATLAAYTLPSPEPPPLPAQAFHGAALAP
jgi:hypothetical protein